VETLQYHYCNAVDRELTNFRNIDRCADRACDIEINRHNLLVSHGGIGRDWLGLDRDRSKMVGDAIVVTAK
jgi:hypothetical protein